MSELEKLNDLEFERVDGGLITYNPIEEAWQAINDNDYSVLGTFPGEYMDGSARLAAIRCALRSGFAPSEEAFGTVMRNQKSNSQ